MRRPILLSTMTLGAVATALGAAGTWADFQDSVPSQEIQIDSGEFREGADIVVAFADGDGRCPRDVRLYHDTNELVEPIILEYNIDGRQDATAYQEGLTADLCVRNIGSTAVTLGLVTDVLEDSDPYCSGEEESVPGETCGLSFEDPDPKPGELDDAYTLTATQFDLDADGVVECTYRDTATIADLRDGDVRSLVLTRSGDCAPGDVLRSGSTASFHLSLAYDPGFDGRDAAAVARLAQSDRVVFQYVIGANPV